MKTKSVSKPCDLIVALDYPSGGEAEALIQKLSGLPIVYKVGLELFIAEGPKWIEKLTGEGHRVFLDLKLHDIPNTVASALKRIEALGVEMTTIHVMGGRAMCETASGLQTHLDKPGLRVLGVSILTSHSESDWSEWTTMWAGQAQSLQNSFRSAIAVAKSWPLGGLVCSTHELSMVRSIWNGAYTVVPGIRPQLSGAQDQARVATPEQAAKAGASAIVVGRPITQSIHPRQVAESILKEVL